jgi:aldose 1-epimerase
LKRAPFGRLPDGTPVDLLTINSDTIELSAMAYGATIVSLRTPDRDGRVADVTLGFDSLEPYLSQTAYVGAVVGRYANRIAGAAFEIDGTNWQLSANDSVNQLHGGAQGFDRRLWNAELVRQGGDESIVFSRLSPAGEEGYPGTLRAEVRYVLRGPMLDVVYTARTDAPTHINLSQHTYFDLSGGTAPDVLDHLLMIQAARYTPVDAALIPTGEIASVDETPFDFRSATRIGRRLGAPHEQLRNGSGYDHNFVLDIRPASLIVARVAEERTRRTLEIRTTEPGLQLYSGNHLDEALGDVGGRRARRHSGFCLETQHFPDTPHHPHFPSTRLDVGRTFRSRTTYTFGVY